MTTYTPYDVQELQDLLMQAETQKQAVFTRGKQQDGMCIDFQNWNKIKEIDLDNLTVTVERAVTLGKVEEAVNAYGLHIAAMTDDLCAVPIGDFFAEQMLCLTSLFYNQPRFQILGLEVILVDGTILSVAGKTVKNVTGYDMCRFYISNRETLAIPLTFTLKLVSLEPVQVMLEADLTDETVLSKLVARLREQNLNPQVCLYWNAACTALLSIPEQAGKLILVCYGSKQRVERELQLLAELADALHIDLQLCTQPEYIWQSIGFLRDATVWHDGLKVPAMHCVGLLTQLEDKQIGCWYAPLQGSLQLIAQTAEKVQYQFLSQQAEALGGANNWYYAYLYGFASGGEITIWKSLKQKFDPQMRLNPLVEGSAEHGTE